MNLEEVLHVFDSTPKPQSVLRTGVVQPSDEERAIEADYSPLLRGDVTDEVAGMMVCDLFLMSDEAVLYFLPPVARSMLKSRNNMDMLESRLMEVDHSRISPLLRVALIELCEELGRQEALLRKAED